MKKVYLLLLCFRFFSVGFAQTWVASGPNDSNQVSYDAVGFTNMALDVNDNPYVIYKDAGKSNKATVRLYSSGKWNTVGNAGFTSTAIEYADIAIAPDGTPYIVYQSQGGPDVLNATVMKFSSGSWTTVGSTNISQQYSFNSLSSAYPSIAIAVSPDNIPYIAYHDYNDPNVPLAATVKKFDGTTWTTVGTAGFTGADPFYSQALALDFAIAPDGTPYILFTDNSPNLSIVNEATLMKFDGVDWVLVGDEGFSNSTIAFPSLYIAADGTPFVGYQDISHSGKATVKKFDGLNWENVGTIGFSAGGAEYLSIAVTSEDLPIVAYKDIANGNIAAVKLFDGLNWNDAGSTDFSRGAVQFPKIALSSSDVPFIVYQDVTVQLKATVKKLEGDWTYVGSSGISGYGVSNVSGVASKLTNNFFAAVKDNYSGKATVLESDNNNWTVLGSPDFSEGTVDFLSIALSSLDETVHVAYRDGAHGGKATVAYLAPDGWALLGDPGFSAGTITSTSLAFAPDNTPYIAYSDGANGNRLTVQKYNGSNWVNVGSAGFSTGIASYISLKIASDGTPYVVYFDNTNGKATAKKFTGAWVNVGPATGFSSGVANYISLAINASNVPYVGYQNGVNGTATVLTFNGTSWVNVGAASISASIAKYTSLKLTAGGNPVLAYQDGANGNKLTVKQFASGSWTTVGSNGFSAGAVSDISLVITPDNTIRTIYSDGYAWARSFLSFVPVPVKLISFTATRQNAKVDLQWETSSEVNNDYFIVEHSDDGQHFNEIGRKQGINSPIAVHSYELIHNNPALGTNYYRLKQVDFDGKITIYPIRTVIFSQNDFKVITLFPNPAKSTITLYGDFGNVIALRITNVNGQKLMERTINSNSQRINVDVSKFQKGIYFVTIDDKASSHTLQFVKE